MPLPRQHRTALLTAAAMAAFAANSLLCRGALGAARIDAVTFTTVRILSGAAMLGVLARATPAGSGAGSWPSALALFGYAIAFSLAYTRIPAGIGALLLFGAVQATMIGHALARGTRLRPGEWLGLGMALGGLVVLTRPGAAAPDPAGALLMVLAGAAWGVYTLRGGSRVAGPLQVTAGNFALAVAPALVTTAAASAFLPMLWSPGGVLLAVASGALASGVGYAIWYAALPGLAPHRAAIVQLSAPVLAAIGGVLLLGEAFTARLALATPLVLGGIALAIVVRSRR